MKNKKKVWQTRPTLIEHLKRCNISLEEWVNKNSVTDEDKLISLCKYLDVIPPKWSAIEFFNTIVEWSGTVKLEKNEITDIALANKEVTIINDEIGTFETQEENSEKKKRVKKIAIVNEKLSPATKETED
jgi:hypothetical protein